MSEEKSCTKCNELKPLIQFNKVNGKHLAFCAKCQYVFYQRPAALRRLARLGKKPREEMERMSEEQKKQKARDRVRKWSKENRARKNEAEKRRRAVLRPLKEPKPEKPVKAPRIVLTPEERKAKRRETKRLYRQKNPEKAAAERRRYREKYPEKARAAKKRARAQPGGKITKNIRNRLKEVLKGNYKKGKYVDMLGCTSQELKAHLEAQFVEGMTWDNYGSHWHIDHIKPLCSVDQTNDDELKSVTNYQNLRPLWAAENSAKTVQDKKMKWRGDGEGKVTD